MVSFSQFEDYITVEPRAGSSIHDCINEAMSLSRKLNTEVKFNFNGVDMSIRGWVLSESAYYDTYSAKMDELNKEWRAI